MEEVTQGFSVSTIAAAKTIIEDTIDAAFTISAGYYIPTSLKADIILDAIASRSAGGTKKYSMQTTLHAYHGSAVNTTMKDNLTPVFIEWEDTITDSGLYNSVKSVIGNVVIYPDDFVAWEVISEPEDGVVTCTNLDWDTCHDATDGTGMNDLEDEYPIGVANYLSNYYNIWRGFFYFDLSGVSGTISGVKLRLQGTSPGLGVVSSVAVFEGTQTSIVGGGLVEADYDSYDTYFGYIDPWVEGSNVIDLNAAGLAYIQSIVDAGGIALLCVRERDHDYLDAAPLDSERFNNIGYYSEHTTTAEKPTLLLSL